MSDETEFARVAGKSGLARARRWAGKETSVASIDLEVTAPPGVAHFHRDPQRRRSVQPQGARGYLHDQIARLSCAAERLADEHIFRRRAPNCTACGCGHVIANASYGAFNPAATSCMAYRSTRFFVIDSKVLGGRMVHRAISDG